MSQTRDEGCPCARGNGIVRPTAAWFTVNRRCGFRCKWCYGKGTKFDAKKEMTLPFASEMVQIIAGAGVTNLVIIGGEPTLWKPLTHLNALCSELNMKTSIVTNAMQFGNDAYWQRYMEHPNTIAGISLKAGTPDQLLETAEVRNFEMVEKGIRRGIGYFNTGVSITYNTYYTESLVQMVRYAISCGASSVKIDFCSPVFENDEVADTYMVEPRLLVTNILRDYPELDQITQGNIVFEMNTPLCIWPKEFIEQLKAKNQITTVCHMVKRQGIVLSHDGQLTMCNGLFDYPIGQYGVDFTDSESLIAHINSETVNGFYSQITRCPSDECQRCVWYTDCGGGCPLRWAVYNPNDLIHAV